MAPGFEDDVQLLEHELGHCLGLADDPWGLNSIMYDYPNGSSELTEHDEALISLGDG
jgi:hypothetical protein